MWRMLGGVVPGGELNKAIPALAITWNPVQPMHKSNEIQGEQALFKLHHANPRKHRPRNQERHLTNVTLNESSFRHTRTMWPRWCNELDKEIHSRSEKLNSICENETQLYTPTNFWFEVLLFLRQLNEVLYPCFLCFVYHNSLIFFYLSSLSNYGAASEEKTGGQVARWASPKAAVQRSEQCCVPTDTRGKSWETPVPEWPALPHEEVHSACLKDLFAREGLSKVQAKFAPQ